MRSWWRPILITLGVLLFALAGAAWWLVRGFDGERVKAIASAWMREHHGRALVFDGPVRLELWPQPAVAVQRVRLSERGQPDQIFASIDSAALALHLEPLLRRREIAIESVSARGVTLHLTRDAAGASNVDDLLERVAGGGDRASAPFAIDQVELAEVEVRVDDAAAGVRGRLALPAFSLGAFGPGLRSPLRLQAQAALEEPALTATLEVEAGLSLLPPAQPGAPPPVQLDQPRVSLLGQGLGFEALELQLRAGSLQVEAGAERGLADAQVDIADAQLQLRGRRSGWQVDAGELGWKRLRLGLRERQVALEQVALDFQGRRDGTSAHGRLRWPALDVRGDRLAGSAVEGSLVLGGDQRLQLELRSQPPSGTFERLTLPALQLDGDGQLGAHALQGRAEATLVLQPEPFAATLDGLALQLQLDDTARPALVLALQGQGKLGADGAAGYLEGTVNDQRIDARFDVRLGGTRPFVDLQADIGALDLDRFVVPNAAPAPAPAARRIDLQPLRAVDGRLRLNVARLLRPPYRIDALALQAGIDDGRLALQRLSGRAWGGRFDANGSADAASGGLALRLRADQVDMRSLLADTIGFDGLRGRARIEADLRGRGATVGALRASLAGTARVSLQPAAVRGVDLAQTLRGWRTATQDRVASDAARQTDFSRLEGSFVLRDGVARNDDLDGRSETLHVGGEGMIDLAQGRLDYLVRARVVNTASGRAGPEMVLLNGVTVPVQLNGPFGDVQWQVNWGAVTAAVAARSVPNVARGTVGTVTRGATGVARGAAGVVRGAGGALRGGSAEPAPR